MSNNKKYHHTKDLIGNERSVILISILFFIFLKFNS
jgi:hypothetical protein